MKTRVMELVALAALVGWGTQARAQSTAELVDDPGSTVTVAATVVAISGSTTLDDSDSDTANVSAFGTVTLFPDAPSANHALLHNFAIDIDPLALHFCFLNIGSCLSGANITITDLHIETTSPGDGPLAGGGDVTFDGVVTHATGVATVVGTGLLAGQIDQVVPIDVSSTGTLAAHVSVAAGSVTLDGFNLPPTSASVPPENLPSGFDSITVDLVVDASNVSLSGAYVASLLGDADADGDIDLADHAAFVDCMTGPLGVATPPCTLLDLDVDGDVDLRDFAAMQGLLAPSR